MAVLPTFSFRLPTGLLLAGSLLFGSCTGSPDTTNGTGVTALPLNMMGPLHTMAQNSQALPPTDNLDAYFAQLMRENHRAAVASSWANRSLPVVCSGKPGGRAASRR
ncbi:MAG: hypothetical protein EOO59_01870, partial [Hymenobacter sp.]